jgi:hypothetical protein
MLSGDGIRYSAPGLVERYSVSPTTHSDTHPFATLIPERITEEAQFFHDPAVIYTRITEEWRLPRPDGQDGKRLSGNDR